MGMPAITQAYIAAGPEQVTQYSAAPDGRGTDTATPTAAAIPNIRKLLRLTPTPNYLLIQFRDDSLTRTAARGKDTSCIQFWP